MPELPEVETIRRGLEKYILGKKIIGVEIKSAGPINGSAKKFTSELVGNSVRSMERHGKLLAMRLAKGEKFLLAHLKMTGQLVYVNGAKVIAGGHSLPRARPNDLPSKYTWVIFKFIGGPRLFFSDMRRFGYLRIVDKKEMEKIAAGYGVEPLSKSFTLEKFKNALASGKKSPIKAALLDQSRVAGIGNIYADEICFAAGARPDRRVATLSDAEIKKLFAAVKAVLKKALAFGGTTFRDYADAGGQKGKFMEFLKVYGRAGKGCLRCRKGVIIKTKQGGRGTSFCSICQK